MLAAQIPAPSAAVAGLATALNALITSVKSKETAMQDVESVIPGLVAAAADLANLGTELKTPENQAYLAYAVLSSLGV